MLTVDPILLKAFGEDHQPGWTAAAFYGPEETVPDVPLTEDGSITFSADGSVEAQGSVYLARDVDYNGKSLVPKELTDPLAPNGQELELFRTVTVGEKLLGKVSLGRFRITQVPDTVEYFRRWPSLDPSNPANDRNIVVGWACELKLEDRFESIIADDFIEATGPRAGNSCWAEMRRLSPYPIVVSLPDQDVPAGTSYSSRMDAIKTIAEILGGAPSFTREGALTVRERDTWMTADTPQFTIDGVISMNQGLSNDFVNQVQVTSTLPGVKEVGTARITDLADPLAVGRPIGGRTYKTSLPLKTKAQLDSAAAKLLRRLSTRQASTVTVRCPVRPDLDLGDFGLAIDPVTGREVLGEIASMRFSMKPLADMEITMVAAVTR